MPGSPTGLLVILCPELMETLQEHFDSLGKWLSSIGLPAWNDVLFIEDLQLGPFAKKSVSRNEFSSLEDFSKRFDELLKEGHNWLNLGGLGILDDTLIVCVEKPRSNANSPTTSVNRSGPKDFVRDNGYSLENFLEITRQ